MLAGLERRVIALEMWAIKRANRLGLKPSYTPRADPIDLRYEKALRYARKAAYNVFPGDHPEDERARARFVVAYMDEIQQMPPDYNPPVWTQTYTDSDARWVHIGETRYLPEVS
jgi:hypothetical protein